VGSEFKVQIRLVERPITSVSVNLRPSDRVQWLGFTAPSDFITKRRTRCEQVVNASESSSTPGNTFEMSARHR
jgi:hypothetical protein